MQLAAEDVVRIAREAGWPAQICDRAGFFDIVEVWVDDCSLVEVLDPNMQKRYRDSFSRNTWKGALKAMASGGRHPKGLLTPTDMLPQS